MKETKQDPIYRPYTTILEWRTVPHPIMVNGAMVTKYQAPVVTEYVSMGTGEIIPASDLKDNPDVWPATYPVETMQFPERKASAKLKPTPKVLTPEQAQAPLFWEVIPPPKYPGKHAANIAVTEGEPKERKKTRPSKSAANPHNALFKDCSRTVGLSRK